MSELNPKVLNEADTEALLRDLAGRMEPCPCPRQCHLMDLEKLENCCDCKLTGAIRRYPRLSRPCRGVGYCLCEGPGCYNCGGSGWQPIPLAEVAGAALRILQEMVVDETKLELEWWRTWAVKIEMWGDAHDVWGEGESLEAALLTALAGVNP